MCEVNLLAQRKAPFLKPSGRQASAFLIVPNRVRDLASADQNRGLRYSASLRLSRRHSRRLLAQSRGPGLRGHARCLARHCRNGSGYRGLTATTRQSDHHSDCGVEYALIAYRQRLAECLPVQKTEQFTDDTLIWLFAAPKTMRPTRAVQSSEVASNGSNVAPAA